MWYISESYTAISMVARKITLPKYQRVSKLFPDLIRLRVVSRK